MAPGRWEELTTVVSDRSNNYHSFSAEIQTRFWHGLTSQLAYTWSKQMDNAFGEQMDIHTGHVIGGQWHPDWSYGVSDANHAHRFTASFTYQLPGESIANRWLKEARRRMATQCDCDVRDRRPLHGLERLYEFLRPNGRCAVSDCNGNLSRGQRTPFTYFDTSCFAEPAASTDPQYTDQGINNLAISRGQ